MTTIEQSGVSRPAVTDEVPFGSGTAGWSRRVTGVASRTLLRAGLVQMTATLVVGAFVVAAVGLLPRAAGAVS